MHRWGRFFFSLLLMGGALWITVPAVKQWWIYYELKQSVPAELLSGAVVPQGEELWGWEITYAYEIEGTRFLRTELCRAPLFRHPEIAKKRLLEKAFSLRAYYSPSTPKRATLECYFPLKELIYSGLAWAIWLYMILFLYHAWPDRCLDRRTERRTWP